MAFPFELGALHVSVAWPWPTATFRSRGAVGTVAGIVPQPGIALQTLNRPAVITLPASEAIGSTALRSRAFNCATVRSGSAARTSAAPPATNGVAIDVPENPQYPEVPQPDTTPGGTVEPMFTPGAARSTDAPPKLES